MQLLWAEGPHIYAAHLEGTTWVADGGALEVDAGHTVAVGAYSKRMSAAFDGETPWISWFEHSVTLGYQVFVARWTGMGWSLVGGALNVGIGGGVEPSIALFGGVPYVAWSTFPADPRTIYVMRWNGSAWESVGGPPNIYSGDMPSFAFVGGKPTVAFRDSVNTNAYYGYVRQWNGSSWVALGGGPIPSAGYDLNVGITLTADEDAVYVGIAEVVSQADNTRRYRIASFNPRTSGWNQRVVGPYNSPASLPSPDIGVKVIGTKLYNMRVEPGGDVRVSVFQ